MCNTVNGIIMLCGSPLDCSKHPGHDDAVIAFEADGLVAEAELAQVEDLLKKKEDE